MVKVSENESKSNDDYTTVRLPRRLMEEIDSLVLQGVRGYRSRSEFIKEATRSRLEQVYASLNEQH